MKLVPLSEAKFRDWSELYKASFIEDIIRARGLPQKRAKQIAEEELNRLLPDRHSTNDNFLYSGVDETGKVVGFVWFCLHGTDGRRWAYLQHVLVNEPDRQKGHGRTLMLLAEQEAKSKGAQRLGLHVLGINDRAIRLYQSLGYLTTDLVMEKSLAHSR